MDVLLGLKEEPNIDLYVTGSNSRMLSMDIPTEFKDRGEEIRVNPLTYDEFVSGISRGQSIGLDRVYDVWGYALCDA